MKQIHTNTSMAAAPRFYSLVGVRLCSRQWVAPFSFLRCSVAMAIVQNTCTSPKSIQIQFTQNKLRFDSVCLSFPNPRYQKGYACASFDKDYATAGHRQSCMNYLEPSGYVFFELHWYLWENIFEIQTSWVLWVTYPAALPRLALLVAMAMVPAGLVLLAPDCGSWGIPSRYTSMRTYHNAMGCPLREFVDRGNIMISRTAVKTSAILFD